MLKEGRRAWHDGEDPKVARRTAALSECASDLAKGDCASCELGPPLRVGKTVPKIAAPSW